MPPSQRRVGGTISVKVNGEIRSGKGEWTYNLGRPKRSEVIGSDTTVTGFSEKGQAPRIAGIITDRGDLDVPTMLDMVDGSVTLALANGKVISLTEAWFSGDGDIKTDEGDIDVEFKGIRCEEVR